MLTSRFKIILLQMWIQFQLFLCLPTKYFHLVLIQAFVTAKLQLRRPIVKVHIAHGISNIFAEITSLCSLK